MEKFIGGAAAELLVIALGLNCAIYGGNGLGR